MVSRKKTSRRKSKSQKLYKMKGCNKKSRKNLKKSRKNRKH